MNKKKRRPNTNQKNNSKADKRNGIPFWGDDESLPDMTEKVVITDDPAAVPRSLGNPPLPGNEVAAAKYFEVIHQRAVQFGGALAASAGLL